MTPRLLQRSPGRTVEVEKNGAVIRKTFTGEDPEALLRLAEAEFSRLHRFHEALRDVPGAYSPRPVEIRAGVQVDLRMERAPGEPLLLLLRSRRLSPELADRLATVAASAVIRYLESVGEAYTDFQFDNMLFDEASGTVTFVDLGVPDHSPAVPASSSPLEMTLGNMVGSTAFQSARPRWVLAARQHRQAVRLCEAIVEALSRISGAELSAAGLRACAGAAYERCAFKEDRVRRLWYSSAGYLLARRPRTLGFRFSPPRRPTPSRPETRGRPSRSVPGRTNRK